MAVATEIAGSSGSARDGVLARLRDRLSASDPALSRLRMASRALLSLFLTGGVLAAFTPLHPMPIAAYGLGVVIAFTGSMAIRDKGNYAQLLSRLYALAVTVVAVLVASLLAPAPVVADLVFLVVIFVAAFVRKYGPRWFGIGMIGFLAYFMGDYLRPAPGDIGWLALASALAFAVTHSVTTVIMPDDAERDLRRALATIDGRINLILRDLLKVSRQGASGVPDRAPLQAHLSQLREIVLMAEGFIPQGTDGALAARGAASDLAVGLFDLQLMAERMVRASYIALPPERLLRAVLEHDVAAIARAQAEAEADAAGDGEVAPRLLLRVVRGRARLDGLLGGRPSPAFASGPDVPAITMADAPAKAAGKQPPVPASLHLPIQVTLACAIAMGCGLLLSPVRWYWAVITAFIVFNNARSRADTALRGLQRSGGTFAGVIGGTVLATLLHGQLVAAGIAIPVLFFLAFYFLQVSYSLMIFFVTLALALLYGLLGSFTPELLLVRLEETVLGSVAGTLVAFFIFPARAALGAGTALDGYLKALQELVTAAIARAHGEPEPLHLLARSRLLDRSYTELATAVRPLGGPWGAVTRFGEVRERLLLLTGCAHWGRVLAHSLKPGDNPPAETLARIDVLGAEIDARVAAAEAIRDNFFERPDVEPGTVTAATPRPPLPISEREDPVFALEVISALLDRATLAPDGRRS